MGKPLSLALIAGFFSLAMQQVKVNTASIAVMIVFIRLKLLELEYLNSAKELNHKQYSDYTTSTERTEECHVEWETTCY